MGGLKKHMPDHVLDLRDRVARPRRHLPVRRLLVEGRDPRRRARQRLRRVPLRRAHRRVHDRGVHDALHLPHLPRRAARQRRASPPARVAAADHRAARVPRRSSRSSPASCRRRCCASSVRRLVRAGVRDQRRHASRLQRRRSRWPVLAAAVARWHRGRPAYYFRNLGPRGVAERAGWRTRATRSSPTSTTSTTFTPTAWSAASRARSLAATYWFNQNIIDGIVNGAAALAVMLGSIHATTSSTRKWSTELVNGIGASAEAGGGALRTVQTGKVQQYAAVLFGALIVFAVALWRLT